jgi:hypothetical protein
MKRRGFGMKRLWSNQGTILKRLKKTAKSSVRIASCPADI